MSQHQTIGRSRPYNIVKHPVSPVVRARRQEAIDLLYQHTIIEVSKMTGYSYHYVGFLHRTYVAGNSRSDLVRPQQDKSKRWPCLRSQKDWSRCYHGDHCYHGSYCGACRVQVG